MKTYSKHFAVQKVRGVEGVLSIIITVCEVGTVSKTSDCQPECSRFNPRPGRGLNFGKPSFATPSVDRDVKPLV